MESRKVWFALSARENKKDLHRLFKNKAGMIKTLKSKSIFLSTAAEIAEQPDTDKEKTDDGSKPANGMADSSSKSQSGASKKVEELKPEEATCLETFSNCWNNTICTLKKKKEKVLCHQMTWSSTTHPCLPHSSRSSDGCPSPGQSRPATGTKPQRRTLPSRESVPPLLLPRLLGAKTQTRTEAELSKDLCPLEPGAPAPVPAPFCDPRSRTLRWPWLSWKGSLATLEGALWRFV